MNTGHVNADLWVFTTMSLLMADSYLVNWILTGLASFLGIVLTVLKILDWVRDRPAVSVSLTGPWVTYLPNGVCVNPRRFRLEAVNAGRRPTTLTHAGFRSTGLLRSKWRWTVIVPGAGEFPAELKEGQLCKTHVQVEELQELFDELGAEKLVPYFGSSVGRCFVGGVISRRMIHKRLEAAEANK